MAGVVVVVVVVVCLSCHTETLPSSQATIRSSVSCAIISTTTQIYFAYFFMLKKIKYSLKIYSKPPSPPSKLKGLKSSAKKQSPKIWWSTPKCVLSTKRDEKPPQEQFIWNTWHIDDHCQQWTGLGGQKVCMQKNKVTICGRERRSSSEKGWLLLVTLCHLMFFFCCSSYMSNCRNVVFFFFWVWRNLYFARKIMNFVHKVYERKCHKNA